MAELIPWWNLLPQPPDQNKLLLAQQNMLKLQEMQRQQQSQNALRQMFADPRMVDPNSGQFSRPGAAISAIGQQDPSMAMDMQSSMAKSTATGLQNQLLAGKVREEEIRRTREEFLPSRDDYYQVLRETGSVEMAKKAGQGTYDGIMKRVLPTVSPEMRQQLMANPNFDIDRMNRNLMADPNFRQSVKEEQEFTTQTDYGRTPPVQYRLYKNGRMTDITGAGAYTPTGVAETKGAEAQLYEGKDAQGKPVTVRMGPMGGFVDAQTNQPMQNVSGLRKIGSGAQASPEAIQSTAEMIAGYKSPPPGSYAMSRGNGPEIMEAVRAINPNYDATKYGAARVLREGYSRTTPSSPGGQVLAVNTATQHLEQLQGLADALKNKDIPAANRVLNYVQTQLGHPEVTSYDAAAGIVADEVLKSVIGAGAVFDRAAMQANLVNTRSPEQIRKTISTIKGLMGGRVNSLRLQWDNAGLADDEFLEHLSDESREALTPYLRQKGDKTPPPQDRGDPLPGGASVPIPPAPNGAAQPPVRQGTAVSAQSAPQSPPADALPQEAVSKLQEGQETTFSNGQVWTLKGGNAVRVR